MAWVGRKMAANGGIARKRERGTHTSSEHYRAHTHTPPAANYYEYFLRMPPSSQRAVCVVTVVRATFAFAVVDVVVDQVVDGSWMTLTRRGLRPPPPLSLPLRRSNAERSLWSTTYM